MSSIRPLITITILAIVGVFLYVKINEGPARHVDAGAANQTELSADVPPLTPLASPSPTGQNSAPHWPSVATPAAAPPTAAISNGLPASVPPLNPLADVKTGGAKPSTSANPAGLPEMPAIPVLPGMPEQPAANNPAASITPAQPINPPIGVPNVRYPDAPQSVGIDQIAPSADLAVGASPLVTPPVTVGADAASNSPPPAVIPATPETEHSPSTDSALAAVGLTPRPVEVNTPTTPTVSVTPAPSTQRNTAEVDRYAMQPAADSASADAPPVAPLAPAAPVSPTNPVTPAVQSFAASWSEVETVLKNRQLSRAHQLLTPWYGSASLTPAEAQKVETLLSQLAGTVIYSTEHQLEPAYTVRPGDTLETIAKQYEVPWQLLAKINGVAAADQVRPGQELKVIRGPFSAVVSVNRNQLELLVDGRYAGKFPVTVASNADLGEGQWIVDQKLVMPAATASSPASAVDRAIILRDGPSPSATPASLGRTLTIASAASSAGPAANAPDIRVSPQDAEEISDILSVGSRVVIRR